MIPRNAAKELCNVMCVEGLDLVTKACVFNVPCGILPLVENDYVFLKKEVTIK
jgi:hypothetical protein